MNSIGRLRFVWPLILMGLMAGLYQNCGQPQAQTTSSDAKIQSDLRAQNGNGDGYGGKITYQEQALDGSCGSENVRSEITVDENGQAWLTKDNCQDLATPQPVSVANRMAHDPSYLTYQNRLFQAPNSGEKTAALLCRGDATLKGVHNVMDGLIHVADGNSQTASVKVGQYNPDGSLIRSFEALNTSVTRTDGVVQGFQIFTGVDANGQTLFNLHLTKQNGQWTGFMDYVAAPDDDDPDPFADMIHVPMVRCYEQ